MRMNLFSEIHDTNECHVHVHVQSSPIFFSHSLSLSLNIYHSFAFALEFAYPKFQYMRFEFNVRMRFVFNLRQAHTFWNEVINRWHDHNSLGHLFWHIKFCTPPILISVVQIQTERANTGVYHVKCVYLIHAICD